MFNIDKDKGLTLIEIGDGVSVEDIIRTTGAEFKVSKLFFLSDTVVKSRELACEEGQKLRLPLPLANHTLDTATNSRRLFKISIFVGSVLRGVMPFLND